MIFKLRQTSLRLFPIIAITLAISFFTFFSSCRRGQTEGTASDVRIFMLSQLKGDSASVTARRQIDSADISSDKGRTGMYAAANRAVFDIHHRGDAPLAMKMNFGMLDILENASRRSDADTRQMLNIYVILGAAFSEGGMPNISLDYYMKGLAGATDSAYSVYRAMYYNNIGALYSDAGLYDKAREYIERALKINLRDNNHQEASLNYANLAEIYKLSGDLKAAQKVVQQSLDYLDSHNYPLMLANMRLQQGELYMLQKEYDVAMLRYTAAQRQFDTLDYVTGNIESDIRISELYRLRERPDSAIFYASRALSKAREGRYDASVSLALKELSKIREAQGDFHGSVTLFKESEQLDDSLHGAESQLRLRNWEALGHEIRPAGLEDRSTVPVWLYVILGVALAAVALLLWLYLRARKASTEKPANGASVTVISPKEQELTQQLDLRNRELTTISLEKLKMHEGLTDVCDELRTVLTELNPRDTTKRDRIRVLLGKLDQFSSGNADSEFKQFFERVHPDFYKALSEKWPDLTPRDTRLCAFLYLGLSTKEIASLTFREIRSVESARNRLRKKLGLELSDDLGAYLHSL